MVGFELLQDGGSGLGGGGVSSRLVLQGKSFKRRWACSDKSLTPQIRCARMLGLSPNNVETVAKGVDYYCCREVSGRVEVCGGGGSSKGRES